MVFYQTNAAAIVGLDAIADLVDVGSTNAQGRLRIYAGSVPADADAALGGATLLAELNMSNPAFNGATDAAPGASAAAASISDDTSADATGTAAFFRIVDRNEAAVFQGSVSTTGADLNLNTTSITSGANVAVTSLTVTLPENQ